MSPPDATRRTVLGSVAGLAAMPLVSQDAKAEAPPVGDPTQLPPVTNPRVVPQGNGQRVVPALETPGSLLDALREHLGLTETKKGCIHGSGSACTVHLDGRRVVSCLTLA